MKKILPLLLLIAASLNYSCKIEDDFLDVLPRGQVIAKTTADFRKLLDFVDNSRYRYSLSLSPILLDYLTDDVSMDSARWNTLVTTREHFRNLFAFKNDIWTYRTSSFTNDPNWNNMYYIISTCNTILTEIAKADDNVTLQKQLIAETKTHIAYAYLQLVNIYALQYDPQTAAQTKGVPVYRNASALPPLNRSSVQQVYDEVLRLLGEAWPDLPDDVDAIYKHRPSKVAVYAILARTYLYMGDYANAFDYADKALKIRSFLYDYNTIYTDDVDYYPRLIGLSRTDDQEMLLWKTRKEAVRGPATLIVTDSLTFDSLYPDFVKDPEEHTYLNYDLRRTLRFDGIDLERRLRSNEISYIFDSYMYRYKADGAAGGGVMHASVATPELYLIRAECSARAGDSQAALDDVNAICRKRYRTGSFNELTAADFGNDPKAVLDRVLLERRRELYGKDLRLFDIKRLGLAFSHKLGSMRISVPANDPRLVWSVFPDYVEMNSELEQWDRTPTGVKYYDKNGIEIPLGD